MFITNIFFYRLAGWALLFAIATKSNQKDLGKNNPPCCFFLLLDNQSGLSSRKIQYECFAMSLNYYFLFNTKISSFQIKFFIYWTSTTDTTLFFFDTFAFDSNTISDFFFSCFAGTFFEARTCFTYTLLECYFLLCCCEHF